MLSMCVIVLSNNLYANEIAGQCYRTTYVKVLIQDGSEEGLVRKCDLKRTIEWFKTDMCDRVAWRKTALKVDQCEVPSSKISRRT